MLGISSYHYHIWYISVVLNTPSVGYIRDCVPHHLALAAKRSNRRQTSRAVLSYCSMAQGIMEAIAKPERANTVVE